MSTNPTAPFRFEVAKHDEAGNIQLLQAIFTPEFLALDTNQQISTLNLFANVVESSAPQDDNERFTLYFTKHIVRELSTQALSSERLRDGIFMELDSAS